MKSDELAQLRVLKTATCPSLSGKSKLGYQLGAAVNSEGVCTPKSAIYIRLNGNTGGGFYNDDWKSVSEIQQLLDKAKLVTFSTLLPVFKGRSINSAGFTLAALKAEGLVLPAKDNKRSYERADPKAFRIAVEALLRSPAALKATGKQVQLAAGETKPSVPKAKTPSKSSKKKAA